MAANEAPEDLIARAKSGDGEAFRRLTEPLRRELEVHCYRLLGSLHDAEDTLQESLLAAWQGFAEFEGRASLRTWLYRIATNRCLNAKRTIERRPVQAWNVPGVAPPPPTQLGETPWLEPYPDARLAHAFDAPLGPDARYDRTQSIALAFIKGLQALPHRQLAVLILRDVVGFPAAEVAALLDTTVESVNSALKRARAGLKPAPARAAAHAAPPDHAAEDAFVARFVTAYEAADLDALVAFLTDDVFIAMPPMAFEYVGREAARAFLAALFGARRFRLLRTRANGQPAFGMYVSTPDGYRAAGLLVLEFAGERISALTRFERSVLLRCGLPESLSAEN